jgi:tetratricopeptide (TPR) repeat protein
LLNIKGEFYKAIEYLQKDLMISEELGYQKGIAKAVNTLGDVFFLTGNYQRSLHFYDRAIDVTRKIGNKLVQRSYSSALRYSIFIIFFVAIKSPDLSV